MIKTGDKIEVQPNDNDVTIYDGNYVGIRCLNRKYHYLRLDGGESYTVCGLCDCGFAKRGVKSV